MGQKRLPRSNNLYVSQPSRGPCFETELSFLKTPLYKCGKSHHRLIMSTATLKSTTVSKGISILRDYDTAADAKNRVSLRGAKAKYFHVQELSNGSYVLEPRVLVSPDAIPARTLKMLNRSVAQMKKGKASVPIDTQDSR